MARDFASEQEALNRKRLFAQTLLGQNLRQEPAGEFAGRFFVPKSPLQGLSKTLGIALQARNIGALDKESSSLSEGRRKAFADTLRQATSDIPGQPANFDTEGIQIDPETQARPRTTGEVAQVFGENPDTSQLGAQFLIQDLLAGGKADRQRQAQAEALRGLGGQPTKTIVSPRGVTQEFDPLAIAKGQFEGSLPRPAPGGVAPVGSGFAPPQRGAGTGTLSPKNQNALQLASQQAVDKEFAKDFVAFNASGGSADIEKQIDQLENAKTILKKGNVTGPTLGSVPDVIKKFTNPTSIAVREQVEEVVQRNLRLVLGAQFTEKEGERLIARAFNENLSEAENIKRLDRLIKQMKQAARAKQEAGDYFSTNGTLRGFKGKLFTIDDFLKDDDSSKQQGSSETGIKFLGFE